ncbi:sel1 repeat family protein [Pelomyxa schiedti]|nr:sel1 repeat family protein [Pelomyxa schiedti]
MTGAANYGGGDLGVLVVRLVWEWLIENSRFYCVKWDNNERGQRVVITFGVSLVLLTLTHQMRWWVQRRGEYLVHATQDHLFLQKGPLFILQYRVTGQRALLLNTWEPTWCGTNPRWAPKPLTYATNSKWLAVCDCNDRVLVLFEAPETMIKKSTVVSLNSACKGIRRWKDCMPDVRLRNEDHCVLLFTDHERFCEIAIVDLRETFSSKTLIVVSSTVPRLADLNLSDYACFSLCWYAVLTRVGGGNVLVTRRSSKTSNLIIMVDEGTGKLHQIHQAFESSDWSVSQLNESQFCVFHPNMDTYTVWDVNDTSKPVRSQQCRRVNEVHFVSDGLLFQVTESGHEILVSEEYSGAHVVTFQLFTPLTANFTPCLEMGGITSVDYVGDARRRAGAGDTDAMCSLATYHLNGWHGVARDAAAAVSLWREAAEAGDRNAMWHLGSCYLRGNCGMRRDIGMARAWYLRGGHKHGLWEVGMCHYWGCCACNGDMACDGAERDVGRAVSLWEEAADLGEPQAMASLGWCYQNGVGVECDAVKAVSLYNEAASRDSSHWWRIGVCYLRGEGVERDWEMAVEMFHRARGDRDAQPYLGWCYLLGCGVERDVAKAVELLTSSAHFSRSCRANVFLAYCHETGVGFEMNLNKASELYNGAKFGHDGAEELGELGEFCQRGDCGVPTDTRAAVGYFRMGAEGGDPVSMFHLGVCLRDGDVVGVDCDAGKSRLWLEKAAHIGHKRALRVLREQSAALWSQPGVSVASVRYPATYSNTL